MSHDDDADAAADGGDNISSDSVSEPDCFSIMTDNISAISNNCYLIKE